MKFAYKVINNKNKNRRADSPKEEIKTINPPIGTVDGVVSFIMVSKNTIAFRECAKIMEIADETGCRVEIAAGKKSGTSESILSLVSLGIVKDKSFVLTIKGGDSVKAFHKISEIFNGESLS